MTRAEAQAEAVRRWGVTGKVDAHYYHAGNKYFVGTYVPPSSLGVKIKGEGDSWESAFADADTRQQKENPTQGGGNRR